MKEHLSGSASPTERTMSLLREMGYTVGKVEYRDFSGTTHDLFGFADILAFKIGDKPLLVQSTTRDHINERVAKIAAEPRADLWRQAGGRIWVVGWDKQARGKRKVFVPTIRDLSEMACPLDGHVSRL